MTTKFSVTKNGEKFTDYHWNEKTKTFSTDAAGLVLDFSGVDGVTFKTGPDCTFTTGPDCTFKTGGCCTFTTGYNCTFTTDYSCTFTTGSDCTFTTGSDCTFMTDWGCTFNTGPNCTFNTGSNCTFRTESNCFVTRYDVNGVIEVPEDQTIKLNGAGESGYQVINQTHTVVIDSKEVEISHESFEALKESLK